MNREIISMFLQFGGQIGSNASHADLIYLNLTVNFIICIE